MNTFFFLACTAFLVSSAFTLNSCCIILKGYCGNKFIGTSFDMFGLCVLQEFWALLNHFTRLENEQVIARIYSTFALVMGQVNCDVSSHTVRGYINV